MRTCLVHLHDRYTGWVFRPIRPRPLLHDNVRQELRRDRTGRMGETTIAFGTSYRDQLHIGLSAGIVSTEMNQGRCVPRDQDFGPLSARKNSL